MVILVAKLCLTLQPHGTLACQAPLFMGFSRQKYWSELSCLFFLQGIFPTQDLPNPGSPALQADSLPTKLRKPHNIYKPVKKQIDFAWCEITLIIVMGLGRKFAHCSFLIFVDLRRWVRNPKRCSAT